MTDLLAIALAYIVGSIPFAFLLSRQRGVDLRQAGSGNVGATNVLRTTDARSAALAMVLDTSKGTLAVLLAQAMSAGVAAPVGAALASVVGHVYPFWLRFRGGKGVATAAGAFAVLAPAALGIAAAVFLVVVTATRFVSLASVAAAVTLAAVSALAEGPGWIAAGALGACVVVVHRHRANLARLVAGTERRLGRLASREPGAP